jgi:hypothetical protein
VRASTLVLDTLPGVFHVASVGVVAGEMALGSHRRDRGATRAHERVEHQIAPVGEQVDQPLGQLDREGRRMADPARTLRRHLPDVGRRLHELVPRDRGLRRELSGKARPGGQRPVEAPVAGDNDAFGQIAQDRVGRPLKRPPRTRSSSPTGLDPDDLAPEEQPQLVLQDPDHVRGQRPVRLAPEVGDVDGDPATRLELADALGEDVLQHGEILGVGREDMALAQSGLVLLAREIGR